MQTPTATVLRYETTLREYDFHAYVADRDALIVEAHNEGLSLRRIARAVNMSAAQICRIIARNRPQEET